MQWALDTRVGRVEMGTALGFSIRNGARPPDSLSLLELLAL